MEQSELAGAARLVLVDGVELLRPEPAVFEAMLAGWRRQQESRLLATTTVESRDKTIRRFRGFCEEFPWRWQPGDVEDWTVSLRSTGRSRSTIRAYQNALAMFMDYLCDARYGWVLECEDRFGEHPVQICHEWNTADHVADYEGSPGRRPFTRGELQAFFDHADDVVARAQGRGRKGGLAAWRDSVLFKVTYGWGLRRREVTMLDVGDFSANAAAPELDRFGMLAVRYGKAMRGSEPRRRNVATVMPWAVEAVQEYLAEVRPLYHTQRCHSPDHRCHRRVRPDRRPRLRRRGRPRSRCLTQLALRTARPPRRHRPTPRPHRRRRADPDGTARLR